MGVAFLNPQVALIFSKTTTVRLLLDDHTEKSLGHVEILEALRVARGERDELRKRTRGALPSEARYISQSLQLCSIIWCYLVSISSQPPIIARPLTPV